MSNAPASVNEVWGVVWKHRNSVIFKGGVVDVLEAFILVQLKAWSWVTSSHNVHIFPFLIGA